MDKAKKYTDTPIKILASGQASDTLAINQRENICQFDATRVAAERAFKQAHLKPSDVQLAEVNDNFTISEILAIEDLGFFRKGFGGKATEDGETQLGSKIAINTVRRSQGSWRPHRSYGYSTDSGDRHTATRGCWKEAGQQR